MNVNSNAYTYTFATVMVVLVAVLLAGASLGLKSKQENNVKQEKMQSILASVGVEVDRSEAEAAYGEVIKEVLTIKGGEVVSTDRETGFNVDMAGAIKAENMNREVPLYVANKGGENYYIIPLRGKGLWGPVWGFVSLESDGNTVVGANFGHKSETPGLGAEIKQRYFMDDFIGEKLLEGSTYKGIKVAKGNNDPKNLIKDDYEVDALAGATITGDGVSAMLKKDIAMYVPYFKTLNN